MSANTGRALWKPFESEFGRHLRLAAANPGLSKTKAGQKQLKDLENPNLYPLPGHQVPQEEVDRLRSRPKNRWALFKPPYIEKATWLCPSCYKMGYHSWLFEMQWLKCCPIHNIPFEEAITSKSATLVRLGVQNSESGLSRHSEALTNALFDPLPYFHALNSLAQFCQLDFSITPVNLFDSTKGAFALDTHDSHYADELIYPSIMLSLFPKSWPMISKAGPHLVKLISLEMDRYPIPDLNRFYLTHVKIRSHYVRERVRKRILHLIRWRSKRKISDHEIDNYAPAEYFHEDMDILCTAYKIWSSIAKHSTDTSVRPSKFCGERLYYNVFGYTVPLIPTPMLGFTEGKSYLKSSPSFISRENALPWGLTLLVYEIDCWCLFRSILMFLTTAQRELAATPNGRLLSRDLSPKIPRWAQPGMHYSEDVSVYLLDDRFLLLFPWSYIDMSCSDIEIDVNNTQGAPGATWC